MDNQKLTKYVEFIYEMESTKFMMDDLIKKIKSEIHELLSYGGKPTYNYDEKPEYLEKYIGIYSFSIVFGIAGIFVLSFISLKIPSGFFDGLFYILLNGLLRFLAGTAIGAVIITIPCFIIYIIDVIKWKKDNDRIDFINSSIMEQNEEERKIHLEKADILNTQLTNLQGKYNETLKTLKTYYDYDIIFPKYRNLIAISSIYEYLLSGKCKELTGPGGAYATYDLESRLDYIIVQLDEVIKKLDQIQNNQYNLYNAINNGYKQSNALLDDINNGILRMEASQELNNYNNIITAKNTEYLKWARFFDSFS